MQVSAIVFAIVFLTLGILTVGFNSKSSAAAAPPKTPINFAVSGQTTTSISLSWTAGGSSVTLKNYTIYRNNVKLATVPAKTLSYTNSGLQPATAYHYRIIETNTNGVNSVESHTVNGLTLANPPTALQATDVTQSAVTLNWAASVNSTALTGYYIYRNGNIVGSVNNTTTTFTDTNLASSVTYVYSVQAYLGVPTLITSAGTPVSITTAAYTSAATILTGCTNISQSGTYVLGNDVNAGATSSCIYIHDTTNVTLDCQNHTITSNQIEIINITNLNTFSVVNCNLSTNAAASTEAFGFDISNSSQGTIMNNTFSGSMVVQASDVANQTVRENTFTNAEYQQGSSIYSYIGFNTLSWLGNDNGASLINTFQGSHNTIDTNSMNGNGSEYPKQHGFDDGINVSYEDSDLVTYNTITNVYDCGFETLGLVTNTTINNNAISNASDCGIGGWWHNSWKGNTVSSNTVSGATEFMFRFQRVEGLQPGEQYVYFENNNFINNADLSQKPADAVSVWIDVLTGSGVSASQTIAVNNTFTGNNFGTILAIPIFKPLSLVVDGGGNTCIPSSKANPVPLACKQN